MKLIGQVSAAICKLILTLWWLGKFWGILDLFKVWKSVPISNEKDSEQCCLSRNVAIHTEAEVGCSDRWRLMSISLPLLLELSSISPTGDTRSTKIHSNKFSVLQQFKQRYKAYISQRIAVAGNSLNRRLPLKLGKKNSRTKYVLVTLLRKRLWAR